MIISPADKQRLALYLSHHCRGRDAALRVPDLARALGWPPRRTQKVIYALRLDNGRVGSTCTVPAGIYWILCEEEAREVAAELDSRIRHISRSKTAIARAWPGVGQTRLLEV